MLAPTDDAFEHLDEEEAEKVFGDKDAAVETVYRHVISDQVSGHRIYRFKADLRAIATPIRMRSQRL